MASLPLPTVSTTFLSFKTPCKNCLISPSPSLICPAFPPTTPKLPTWFSDLQQCTEQSALSHLTWSYRRHLTLLTLHSLQVSPSLAFGVPHAEFSSYRISPCPSLRGPFLISPTSQGQNTPGLRYRCTLGDLIQPCGLEILTICLYNQSQASLELQTQMSIQLPTQHPAWMAKSYFKLKIKKQNSWFSPHLQPGGTHRSSHDFLHLTERQYQPSNLSGPKSWHHPRLYFPSP